MKILRASDYARVPWKNGGGVTREVFVQWCDESHTTWDWRISMADVVQSGPFSVFPDVDRTLSVIDGQGLSLKFYAGQHFVLDRSSEPFSFDGSQSAYCNVIDGPTTDLNVMTVRSKFRHVLRKHRFGTSKGIDLAEGENILLADAAFALRLGDHEYSIGRLDAVTGLPSTADVLVSPIEPCNFFVVTVFAAA
jgi:uncharacterized protein